MGRIANPLTGTQQDLVAFGKLVAKIKRYGIRKLGSYGLITHETINNYCRPKPVLEGTEEKILASIALHEQAMTEAAEQSLQKTRALLA